MRKLITISIILLAFGFIIGYQGIASAKNTPQEEKNITIVKRIVNEGYNQGNTKVLEESVSPNFKITWNGAVSEKTGPDVLRENINANREEYDFTLTILDIFAKEDKVALHWSFKGKHKKSGNQVSFTGVFISRYEKEKLVEGWQTFDNLTTLMQLGYKVIPPPADIKEEK